MRKILCGVLAFVICSFSIITYAEDENTTNTTNTANNVTDLQTKQEEIKKQIEEQNGQLQDVQEELTENLQQVQKLDEKIESSEKELKELNEKIQKLTESTNKLEENLKTATQSYEKQKKLLEEVETKKNIIELANKRLNENLEQLKTIKQTQLTTSKVLQNTKALRENYITKLSDKEKAIQTQIDEYNNQFAEVNKEILALSNVDVLSDKYIGGVMAWPIPGYTKITSNYGMRTHPITGVYKLHTGVDVSAPIGANFVAANDGIVTKACYNAAYGNMVIIDHGGGISTLYAHGSEILVQVGQAVTRGEAVLKVGSTGYSTGAHAHFEVRINGEVTNPIEYITTNKIPESTKQNKNENTTDTENENTLNTTNTTN